jgi:ankyrin repeat protein
MRAADKGHVMVRELLLDHGANAGAIDEDERNALIRAVYSGHKGVVQLLLNSGVDAEARDPSGGGVIRVFEASLRGRELGKGMSISSEDAIGNTVLMDAVGCGHEAIVRLLLYIVNYRQE